jgi:hypothetical protein
MMGASRWEKCGRIFSPSGEADWLSSHAAVPIAEHLEGDFFRIYFSSRDKQNRSHSGYVVVDINRPQTIEALSLEPVLAPGELGAFDDSGTMATWLATTDDGQRYLYYIGWNLGVTVPFRNAIGLAVAGPAGTFSRIAKGPIVDRTMDEPHFCASCCVIPGPDVWRMWYLACTGWDIKDGKPVHRYHIRYAESDDGIHWRREGKVAIDFQDSSEYAISRPSVTRDADCWRMWYSCRGDRYRIGYAESADGIHWQRADDQAGIERGATGWDSEMIEYPFVFDHNGARYMLYNGNGYGASGFGMAIMEKR